MRSGRPPTLWCDLIVTAGPPVNDTLSIRDRAIDPPRQPADHPPLADLGADLVDRLVLEGAHGPVAFGAGNLAHEIAQQRRPARRMHHLGVELHRVELALLVGDRRERRVVRDADDLEAYGQPGYAVAMAHPHRILAALLPHPVEEGSLAHHLDL